jgi:hypothetical protein
MDTYTIYLVNTGVGPEQFWCFLERPEDLLSEKEVFANSQATLEVASHYGGQARFVIPVQYVVAAGASNDAVGLSVQVLTNFVENANLMDTWDATYANAPPPMGPTLAIDSSKVGKNQIAIWSNDFNQPQNENDNQWFSSQSFGIQTKSGFVGMTWSPKPGQTTTLTPKLTFYVAIGNYGSNSLADWTTISKKAQAIHSETDFLFGECTVSYDGSGNFSVSKGKPETLVGADEIKALATLDKARLAGRQTDTLQGVYWLSGPDPDSDYTYLTGQITVSQAVTAAFAFFVLSGVTFAIDENARGQRTFKFSYSGPEAAKKIKSLFKAGATLLFH